MVLLIVCRCWLVLVLSWVMIVVSSFFLLLKWWYSVSWVSLVWVVRLFIEVVV